MDGDISYNSVEMNELTDNVQPLKIEQANSSLHLVEKNETEVLIRKLLSIDP